MHQTLSIALSHIPAGDDEMAARVAANLVDAPEGKRERLNWLHSLAAFDEVA